MIPEIKKILYTTDLSQNARHAFSYAASIANRYGAGVTILHVLEDISPTATSLQRCSPRASKRSRRAADQPARAANASRASRSGASSGPKWVSKARMTSLGVARCQFCPEFPKTEA